MGSDVDRTGHSGYAIAMETHCPTCGSVIYSRRAKLCGVCSALLPEELRITGEQSEKIGTLMKQMEQNIRRMEQEHRDDLLGKSDPGAWI
jgi:uncharacterized Zn finger protein (UPF0148 family)